MRDLRLEPLGSQHLPELDALVRDAEVLRFTPLPEPVPDTQAADMLAAYDADDTRTAFAAVDASGTFLGLAVAVRVDRVAQECELGYMVSRAARGRGAASEMLRQLTAYAFAELGVHRIQLRISAGNVPSERVAARNGYLREGLLRSTYLKPGVRVDTSLWSRLVDDPPVSR